MTGSSACSTVHLVGSAPFATAEEMFRAAEAHLGPHLKRLPDGEVGERDSWIKWQHARIGQSPQFRLVEVDPVYVPVPPYEAIEGVASADDIDLPDLGYADAAIDSFATFRRLTEEGVIAPDRRFQVGLPTPLSVTSVYIVPGSRALFEPAYARALGRELEAILAAIPAEKLAIQWEAAVEFALLEGIMPGHLGDDMLDGITGRLAGLVDLVPAGVEAASICATAIPATSISASRPTPAIWSPSPTASPRRPAARSTGSTCRCRRSATTTPISRRSPGSG